MNKIIDLLGKTVKFVHTENGHFFEEQGTRTRDRLKAFVFRAWVNFVSIPRDP